MLRSLVVSLLLVVGLGYALFAVKYRVQALESELARLNGAIAAEQEALRVLAAEWSYLNRPAVLAATARHHLGLVAADPREAVHPDEVPQRLPRPTTVAGTADETRPPTPDSPPTSNSNARP